MKRLIFVFAAILSVAVVFTSCKDNKKEEVKTETHQDGDHDEMAAKHTYQCPMDCENGKTYDKEGTCPKCKMDLKEKGDNHGIEHAEGCKCKEGGECKCEDGKCECKAEMASKKKDCTKCEEGKCECKAEVTSKKKECTKCEEGKCECKA